MDRKSRRTLVSGEYTRQTTSNATNMSGHAALRLRELVAQYGAGPRVIGFIELHLIGTVRRVCKVLHAVPLEHYLERVEAAGKMERCADCALAPPPR